MKKLIALTLALMLTLCACGGGADETTVPSTEPTTAPSTAPTTEAATEPATEPTSEPTTVPTEPAPVDTNPLTGEALEAENDNRIIAVMINNSSAALPQCGIGQADIIYEILAEGSTTRLMALFTDASDAGPIGPVRSLRAYYLNIMRGYDAICTSAGGSDEADNMVYSLGYDRVNGIMGTGSNYFYRDSWRRENRGYEHSLFITGEDLVEAAGAMDFRLTEKDGMDYGLTFTDDAMEGMDVSKVTIHFQSGGKTTELTYDPDLGYYTAYQQGMDLTDGNTGYAIPFENVLVLYAESYVMDSKAHLYVQTTGEGEGYYLRDGKLMEIKWARADETSPYEYYDLEGNPVQFGVGKSYIAVIPENSPVDLSN